MGSPRRINVTLDDDHADRLGYLARRMHMQEGTLARSLLSEAIDSVDPDPETVVEMLERIPGIHERLKLAEEQVKRGEVIPFDEF